MNILMVGHSRAGKTSFMAAMYKYLGEDYENYGIHAVNDSQREKLKRMANQLTKGKYPAGTDIQQVYDFEFTCGGEKIMPFKWIDYRGGILKNTNPTDNDTKHFVKAVTSADALIVFLDGEKLADDTGKYYDEYDVLISCIVKSLEIRHDSPFPICFVITKYDLIPEGVSLSGLSYFSTLFDQIEANQDILGMIYRCTVNKEEYYDPFFALTFCIYGGTPLYINKCITAMETAKKTQQKHQPETLLGWGAALLEAVASGVAGLVDLDWETELDKCAAAEAMYDFQNTKLEKLKLIANNLKKKIKDWAKKELIITF